MLYERLDRPQEIELACILPVPLDWIEHASGLAAEAAIPTGWCLRVELELGPGQLWMGVTEAVADFDELHRMVN